LLYFKEDLATKPYLKKLESFLISKNDKSLFRPGFLYEFGVFKGLASSMEILRTNITNIVTMEGLFEVSNYEINITDSTISGCYGTVYSAFIFSIQNNKMITIRNSIIKETFS